MKCVSTDTIRCVLRSVENNPNNNNNKIKTHLDGSSYSGSGGAIEDWLEHVHGVGFGIQSVIDDSIARNNSLILEGVHVNLHHI